MMMIHHLIDAIYHQQFCPFVIDVDNDVSRHTSQHDISIIIYQPGVLPKRAARADRYYFEVLYTATTITTAGGAVGSGSDSLN